MISTQLNQSTESMPKSELGAHPQDYYTLLFNELMKHQDCPVLLRFTHDNLVTLTLLLTFLREKYPGFGTRVLREPIKCGWREFEKNFTEVCTECYNGWISDMEDEEEGGRHCDNELCDGSGTVHTTRTVEKPWWEPLREDAQTWLFVYSGPHPDFCKTKKLKENGRHRVKLNGNVVCSSAKDCSGTKLVEWDCVGPDDVIGPEYVTGE